MEQRTGKIKNISKKFGESKKGPYTLFTIEFDDGQKFNTFDKDMGEKYPVGKDVLYTVEKDGQYWKLISMGVVEESEKQPVKTMYLDRDRSITSQCLTKCWADKQAEGLTKEEVLIAYSWFVDNL